MESLTTYMEQLEPHNTKYTGAGTILLYQVRHIGYLQSTRTAAHIHLPDLQREPEQVKVMGKIQWLYSGPIVDQANPERPMTSRGPR